MVQGQTAQKFFAFDEGDVWWHPGHCVPSSSLFLLVVAFLYRFRCGHDLSILRSLELRGLFSFLFPFLPMSIPSHSARYHNFAVSPLLRFLRRLCRRMRRLLLLLLRQRESPLLGGYLQLDPLHTHNVFLRSEQPIAIENRSKLSVLK